MLCGGRLLRCDFHSKFEPGALAQADAYGNANSWNLPCQKLQTIRASSESFLCKKLQVMVQIISCYFLCFDIGLGKTSDHLCLTDWAAVCARLMWWQCWTASGIQVRCWAQPSHRSAHIPGDFVSSYHHINNDCGPGVLSQSRCMQQHTAVDTSELRPQP